MVHVFVAFGFLKIGKVAMSRLRTFIQQDCHIQESCLELIDENGMVKSKTVLDLPKFHL